jgi:hypothetical protein
MPTYFFQWLLPNHFHGEAAACACVEDLLLSLDLPNEGAVDDGLNN